MLINGRGCSTTLCIILFALALILQPEKYSDLETFLYGIGMMSFIWSISIGYALDKVEDWFSKQRQSVIDSVYGTKQEIKDSQ